MSVASIWEIAIKISLHKIKKPKGLKHFLKLVDENGFEILPITFEHAINLSTLEFYHKDPFDRLLVSQSLSDKLILASKDENIKLYKVKTLW